MTDGAEDDDRDIAAGDFSSWLVEIQAAIRGDGASVVPCGTCTACCTSSQFIHIGPDETDTLAHIPPELLSPAPRLPRGHVVLGYDERGHCPMLIEGRCSIYEHRPRTCRTYDCRIFCATGIGADEGQAQVAERARRWRFRFPADDDRRLGEAVRAAARFVRERSDLLPADVAPTNETQRAVLAIEIHEAFLPPSTSSGEEADS